MKLVQKFLLIWLLLPAWSVSANILPNEVVESTINELIAALEERRSELEADRVKLYQMVEDVVVPHFEVDVIARLVLAKHWRSASKGQREDFAQEFKKLLIRTYATALFEYTGNEKLVVKPLRIKEGDKKVKVKTEVTLPGAPPVPVNYSFLLTKKAGWKIYDVNIES